MVVSFVLCLGTRVGFLVVWLDFADKAALRAARVFAPAKHDLRTSCPSGSTNSSGTLWAAQLSCQARQSFQMVTPFSLFSEQRRCPSGAQTVPILELALSGWCLP